MEDPQQQLVYAMERVELRGHARHKANLRQLRRWTRHACRLYGVPLAKVSIRKMRGWGGSYDNGSVVLNPKRDQNGMSLAHELAHHLTRFLAPNAQDHGPTFVYYYGALLHGMRLVPFDGFKAICKRHGVKIGRARSIPRPAKV